jgi:hypothetical protein
MSLRPRSGRNRLGGRDRQSAASSAGTAGRLARSQ